MQEKINELYKLGLTLLQPARTFKSTVHQFVNLKTGEVFYTQRSGYVRHKVLGYDYRWGLPRLNHVKRKKVKTPYGHYFSTEMIMLRTEEERLDLLIERQRRLLGKKVGK